MNRWKGMDVNGCRFAWCCEGNEESEIPGCIAGSRHVICNWTSIVRTRAEAQTAMDTNPIE